MGKEVKLTDRRVQVLISLRDRVPPGTSGWSTSNWVAESCGHFYDSQWAGSQMPALVKAGYVEKGERGWYRITPAGIAALEANRE
jgi:hypothetical protein